MFLEDFHSGSWKDFHLGSWKASSCNDFHSDFQRGSWKDLHGGSQKGFSELFSLWFLDGFLDGFSLGILDGFLEGNLCCHGHPSPCPYPCGLLTLRINVSSSHHYRLVQLSLSLFPHRLVTLMSTSHPPTATALRNCCRRPPPPPCAMVVSVIIPVFLPAAGRH